MRITYGTDGIDLDIPEGNLGPVVLPRTPEATGDIRPVLDKALAESSPPLAAAARGHRVTLLVADATRDQPHVEMAAATFAHLRDAARVRVLVCTGSHRADTPENRDLVAALTAAAAAAALPLDGIRIHDCQEGPFCARGHTRNGTPIRFNAWADDCDLFVVNSDTKPHYFAGYSNALKFFLPGGCAFAGIEANHALALQARSCAGRHPLHPDPDRRDNPLAADMLEFFQTLTAGRPAHALVTIASRREITWAGAGELAATVAAGIQAVDERMLVAAPPSPYVIVSCGGYPNDESLYTAQRGLELTRCAYQAGAEVLFLAECRNGIASTAAARENFYDRLTRPIAEVQRQIEGEYVLYAHKAYKLASLLAEARTVYLHSTLSATEVEAIHLTPAPDPQAVIGRWLTQDPEARLTVFDKANKLTVWAHP